MPLRKETKIGNGSRSAYQDAVEYGIDVCQLEYLLALTPAERLTRHDAALALVLAAREAGVRYYGFNPLACISRQPCMAGAKCRLDILKRLNNHQVEYILVGDRISIFNPGFTRIAVNPPLLSKQPE
jgi:hypothetical protein